MVLTDTLAVVKTSDASSQYICHHIPRSNLATWLCTGITKQLTLAKFWWCRPKEGIATRWFVVGVGEK